METRNVRQNGQRIDSMYRTVQYVNDEGRGNGEPAHAGEKKTCTTSALMVVVLS